MLRGSGELLINGDRYHAGHFILPKVFRLMTDFRQTSDRLQMSDSYFRLWTSARLRTSDFGFWTSDFEFHTSDLILQTDFELETSEFELQTLNFRLRVRILDFGYTSDRPRPSDFELRFLNFRLWTILATLDFFGLKRVQTLHFKLQTLKFRVQKPPLGFNTFKTVK